MIPKNIEEQLQIMQQQVQLIVQQHKQLLKENELLKKQLEKNAHNITQLKNVDTITKQQIQKKIEGYLKEIDQCLLLIQATS
jgi:chromosome segregation ATPase